MANENTILVGSLRDYETFLSCLFFLIFISSIPATAATPIDSCTTITEPGMYTLTTDIQESSASSCLVIKSSDVVINGNGHLVDGQDPRTDPRGFESEGVVVGTGDEQLQNVTITNLVVKDWVRPISYTNIQNGEITGVDVLNSPRGIILQETDGIQIRDTTVQEFNESQGTAQRAYLVQIIRA